MRKIVINSCHGGFSLSFQGVMEYARIKGIQLYPFKEAEGSTFRNSIYISASSADANNLFIYYATEPIVNGVLTKDNYFSVHSIPRDDPALVQVVESLGWLADGHFAELKVVEIPDDVKWEIEENDGKERIAEVHRTWS